MVHIAEVKDAAAWLIRRSRILRSVPARTAGPGSPAITGRHREVHAGDNEQLRGRRIFCGLLTSQRSRLAHSIA